MEEDRLTGGVVAKFDSAWEFFEDLGRQEPNPLLEGASGSVRFDLTRDDEVDHFLIVVEGGVITVSRATANASADCVVQTDEALFGALASGEKNAMAAMLRGDIVADGDPELLMRLQRLFPGPPGSRRGGATATKGHAHA
jgi:putative sterol carrier protein